MDQEEFLRRITELAEIKATREPITSGQQTSRDGHEIFRNGKTISIDPKNNPTWNIAIKKLKTSYKPCEDCGKKVKDRKVFSKMYTFPVDHMRISCNGCQKTKHPETGEFSLTNNTVQAVFTSYLRKRDK